MPAQQAFYPDKTPIAPEDLPQAIADGTARWQAGSTVTMSRAGERFEVPADQALNFARAGGHIESDEERALEDFKATSTLSDDVHAFTGSMLSSATLGAFDAVLDDETQRQEQLARQAAPIASALGDATGLGLGLVGAAATGGAGVAARAVPAAGVTSLARAGARAAVSRLPQATSTLGRAGQAGLGLGIEGAAEGALYSAGREWSRQSLGNEDLNTEKILAAGGEGLLFGGATGGALGFGGRLLGDAAKRIVGGAEDIVSSRVKSGSKANVKLTPEEEYGAKAFGLTKSDVVNIGPSDLRRFMAKAEERGLLNWREDLPTRVQRAELLKEELGAQIGDIYKGLDASGASPDHFAVSSKAAQQMGALRDQGGKFAEIAQKIEREWGEPVWTAKGFAGLHDLDTVIRKSVEPMADGLTKSEMHKFRWGLKEGLLDEIERIAPDRREILRQLDEDYGLFSKVLEKANPRAVAAEIPSSAVSGWDVGVAVSSAVAGSPLGAVYAGSRYAYRKFQQSEQVHAALSQALYNLKRKTDNTTLQLSKGVISTARDGAITVARHAPRVAALVTKEYVDKVDRAREIDVNPEAATARIARVVAPLAETDPVIARNLINKTVEDLRWLSARAPSSTTPVIGLPVNPAEKLRYPEVPTSAAASFLRSSNALANPISVIDDIKNGSLSPESVDMLAERRPFLRQQMEREFDQAAVSLSEDGKMMKYDVSVGASLAVGKPYHFSMTPEFLRTSQGVWAAEREKLSGETAAMTEGGGGGGGQKSAPKMDNMRERLKTLQTPSQDVMDNGE